MTFIDDAFKKNAPGGVENFQARLVALRVAVTPTARRSKL